MKIDGEHLRILFIFILVLCSINSATATTLVETISTIKKSVVAVGTFMPKRSPRGVFLGTGFAVANGSLIVTNAHVIPDKVNQKSIETIAVFIRDNGRVKMLKSKVVAVDKVHDIAVLKLKSAKLPALSLSNKQVKEGVSIAFTGFPIGMVLGLHPVTHRGIVSAISPIVLPVLRAGQLNAKMMRRLKNPFSVYQLDATAYPGNSGSPVYDQNSGQVIGIINKVFVKESKENILSKPSGITYAIPIRYLHDLIKQYNLM